MIQFVHNYNVKCKIKAKTVTFITSLSSFTGGSSMRQIYRREPIKIYEEIQDYRVGKEEIGFSIVRLEKGRSITLNSEGYENVLVIISGTGHIRCEGFEALNQGERTTAFAGPPTAVYIPKETEYTVTGVGYNVLEIAVCKVKAENKHKPFIITPEDVTKKECGQFDWKRNVHEIITDDHVDKVDYIIVGETYGCPGEWASYPYNNSKTEVSDEAVYYFKIFPSKDKGLQVMQSDNQILKTRYRVHNDSAIDVEKDYKPVASVDDSNVYYLWIKRRL